MNRTLLKLTALLLLAALVAPAHAREKAAGYRVGLTPVFLDNQVGFLREWQLYLERRLGAPVEFVQRQTYREITERLLQETLDVAWICGFPYVRHAGRIRLLAVPLYRGEPLYQSYLIVPASDRSSHDITDLQDRIFAYSDPDSNSGYLVPRVRLRRSGIDADGFFARTFFTWGHRDVVVAVADGLAQGGAVDGYVWETLARSYPDLTRRTRVVGKSEKYGFPPFVARASLPESAFQRLQRVLIGMADDPEGRALLRRLDLDGFTPGDERLFDGIRAALALLQGG